MKPKSGKEICRHGRFTISYDAQMNREQRPEELKTEGQKSDHEKERVRYFPVPFFSGLALVAIAIVFPQHCPDLVTCGGESMSQKASR